MSRKIIDYKVEYFDGKKDAEVSFKIKRIPQSVLQEYSELSQVVADVMQKSQRLKTIVETMGDIVINKEPDAKKKIAELQAEAKEIESSIKDIGASKFFDERYRLVRKLLEKNGVIDEKYLSKEFWNDDVDASILMDFLESVVYKDIDGLKKKEL
jgi:hypothetical protein